MSENVIVFNDHKSEKKYKKIIEDIEGMLKVISYSQKALSFYKHYIPAQQMISGMETQKTLLELHAKEAKNKLEAIKTKHST
jgi:hypothetical protein